MALQETAQKAYARYGGDAEKTYKTRRLTIRQQLPQMTGSQLQKRLNYLDEEIGDLKNENAQFEGWVRQIKREGSVNAFFDHMHRTFTESHLGMLQLRLDANKTALEWMQRERQIYTWELRLRRVKGVKVPFLKQRQASLEKKACELDAEIKAAEAKLRTLRGDQEKVQCELCGVNREIELLSA